MMGGVLVPVLSGGVFVVTGGVLVVTGGVLVVTGGVLVVTGCSSMNGGSVPGADNGSAGGPGGGQADSAQRQLIQSDWRLPWSCGERYYVSQGNDGDLCTAVNGDHVFIQNYAWDFALPRHTPVLAARDDKAALLLWERSAALAGMEA